MNKDDYNKHVKFGIFYYDPDNPEESIERRNGMGTTINFGSKAGRRLFAIMMIPAYMAIGIAILLAILVK